MDMLDEVEAVLLRVKRRVELLDCEQRFRRIARQVEAMDALQKAAAPPASPRPAADFELGDFGDADDEYDHHDDGDESSDHGSAFSKLSVAACGQQRWRSQLTARSDPVARSGGLPCVLADGHSDARFACVCLDDMLFASCVACTVSCVAAPDCRVSSSPTGRWSRSIESECESGSRSYT